MIRAITTHWTAQFAKQSGGQVSGNEADSHTGDGAWNQQDNEDQGNRALATSTLLCILPRIRSIKNIASDKKGCQPHTGSDDRDDLGGGAPRINPQGIKIIKPLTKAGSTRLQAGKNQFLNGFWGII